jgi:hypothetical protein
MARIKTESKPLPPAPRRLLQVRPQALLAILLLVGLALAAHFTWRGFRHRIAGDSHYALTVDRIRITPQPPWIRTDIKTQSLRDAGLQGNLSLLQDTDTLCRQIKDAFEFNPWVASVGRIRVEVPMAIGVELVYRKPVAAVESTDPNGIMYLPIDERAVRLPETDLSEAERRYLPRISGITGRPLVGDKWDDPRVAGGARLAVHLSDVWQRLRLVEIVANPLTSAGSDKPVFRYEIVTAGGTHIVWGMTPGDEAAIGESPFVQKRQRLLDYAAQHGKLESIDGPAVLDIRSELIVTPRTARHKAAATTEEETTTK